MTDPKILPQVNRLIIGLGLAQGLVLYALYKTHKEAIWPQESAPLFNALLLTALLLPFIVYWGQGILSGKPMRRLLLVAGLLMLGLGAYQGMTAFPLPDPEKPQLVGFSVFAGLTLLSFMLVPLVSAWSEKNRAGLTLGHWKYTLLFDHSWRNAVITVQAGVLTGLFWAVLQLGAQLFKLIGVDWPKETLEEAWFAIPVTTLSMAVGVLAGLRRAAFTHTLRNHWLTLTAWLLPIVSTIGSTFVLTSITGVDKLFKRGLSAFYLLWFAAFWIKFFNSAFQDGKIKPPFGLWLRRILPYTSPGLLVVVGLAAWALLLRINQHGLTPDRVWGFFVALVALCYGAGYALSLVKNNGWMRTIAGANVLAALMMCVGILLLLSPVLDARRLSTNSQMVRLHSGSVEADNFDVRALVDQGSFGHAALTEIAAQQDAQGKSTRIAIRAKEVQESAKQYLHWESTSSDKETPVSSIETQLEKYPVGKPLPDGFLDFLNTDIGKWNKWERQLSCFDRKNKNARCTMLQIDLNGDGRDEIILWKMLNDYRPWVYTQTGDVWKRVGILQRSSGRTNRQESIQAELFANEFESKAPNWRELRIGNGRFYINENIEAD